MLAPIFEPVVPALTLFGFFARVGRCSLFPFPFRCRCFAAHSWLATLLSSSAIYCDPSGIGTYAVAGASLGLATLWTALITFPMMMAVQFTCARIAMVTGRGLAGVLREHSSPWPLCPVVVALVAANTINAGADIGGYCQVNVGRCNQTVPAVYSTDVHFRLSLPLASLFPPRLSSLRLDIFSLRRELPLCRRSVSDARYVPQL